MIFNGITLPELKWIERYQPFGVNAVVKRTRGGRNWVWEGPVYGRKITLEGGTDFGWMRYSDFKSLLQTAEVQDTRYLFEWDDGDTVTVRYRHEDGDVINGVPVYPDFVGEPDDDDWICEIVIKLEVV